MIAFDFIEDQDGDILIQGGDLVIGESDKEHISDIMESAPGHWKQFPLQGVNLFYFLNSKNSLQTLKNVIWDKLTMDGYIKITTSNLNVNNGKISGQVNAQRK